MSTNDDHLNPKSCRKLANIITTNGRAMSVPKVINQLKQSVNPSILFKEIENYNDTNIAESQSEILDTIEQRMWDAFYEKASTEPKIQYLIDHNIDFKNQQHAVEQFKTKTRDVNVRFEKKCVFTIGKNNSPALETLFEMEQDNNNRIIAIRIHLEDCKQAIKSKLAELRKLILREMKSLKNLIKNEFADTVNKVDKHVDDKTKDLTEHLDEEMKNSCNC